MLNRNRLPWVTFTFACLCVAMFLLDFIVFAPRGVRRFSFAHLAQGYSLPGHPQGPITQALCLRASLVRRGQVWRMISSALLHGGLWHIVPNCAALWIAGSMAERQLGGAKLLLAIPVCGVFANLCVMRICANEFGFGASICIYGVIGLLAALRLKERCKLPWPQRLILLGYLLSNVASQPEVIVEHGASFICGVALSFFLIRSEAPHGIGL